MQGVPITIQDAKATFSDAGCELLDDIYCGNSQPMLYQCNCGKISNISLANFKKGSRCFDCGKERANQKKRHSYEYVVRAFSDAGCELLESEYKNNYTPMAYRCSCGNISKIRFFAMKKGMQQLIQKSVIIHFN